MGAAVKRVRSGSGSRVAVGASGKRKVGSPIDKAKGYEIVWKQVSALFEAARPYGNATFVYLIGEVDDGPVKIGLSTDPIGRLRTMQTGNPRRLRVEYVLVGDMATEKLLHEFWEPFAIVSSGSEGKPNAAPGTEWFKHEARIDILPIIADAVGRQIDYLREQTTEYFYRDLEQLVRDAHADSGIVFKVRQQERFLAQGAGYYERRPSRI